MRAFATTKQQNDYASANTLRTTKMKFNHHPIETRKRKAAPTIAQNRGEI